VLTAAERGLEPARSAEERALVAYLDALRPHRDRAFAALAAQGVSLGHRAAA